MTRARSLLRLAQPEDNAALCRLFAETPLRGGFEIALERYPSYFSSQAAVLDHDVFVGVRDDAIIGCGARVVREFWWQDEPARVAYLGDLRCHPSQQRRAGWLIREGYRTLATAHEKAPAAVTWSAIFEENAIARNMVQPRRAGLPEYIDRGRLHCPILLVPRWAKTPRSRDISFHRASEHDWQEISAFLHEQWRHRPLAPVCRAEDFAQGERWPCLAASDFLLMRRGKQLVGVTALWDLRAVKQVRLIAVHGALGRMRGLLNLLARITGLPCVPDDGAILPMGYLSFFAVDQEDAVLAQLLVKAARAAAAARGWGFLCACAHEDHPFAQVFQRFLAIPSHGRLYQVALGDSLPPWPERAPHIEPALL